MVRVEGLGSDPEARLERGRGRPCPRTSRGRWPTTSATRRSMPGSPGSGGGSDGRTAPHRDLLDRIEDAGASVAAIQLDVGLATFVPSPATTSPITRCTPNGTGSCRGRAGPGRRGPAGRGHRTHGAACSRVGGGHRGALWRELAVHRAGVELRVVDVLMTNFHDPWCWSRRSSGPAGERSTPRRWPATTGSCCSATRCSWSAARDALVPVGGLRRRGARAGVVTTAHNEIPTPMFMPVGTRGSCAVDLADLEDSTPRSSWGTPIT